MRIFVISFIFIGALLLSNALGLQSSDPRTLSILTDHQAQSILELSRKILLNMSSLEPELKEILRSSSIKLCQGRKGEIGHTRVIPFLHNKICINKNLFEETFFSILMIYQIRSKNCSSPPCGSMPFEKFSELTALQYASTLAHEAQHLLNKRYKGFDVYVLEEEMSAFSTNMAVYHDLRQTYPEILDYETDVLLVDETGYSYWKAHGPESVTNRGLLTNRDSLHSINSHRSFGMVPLLRYYNQERERSRKIWCKQFPEQCRIYLTRSIGAKEPFDIHRNSSSGLIMSMDPIPYIQSR